MSPSQKFRSMHIHLWTIALEKPPVVNGEPYFAVAGFESSIPDPDKLRLSVLVTAVECAEFERRRRQTGRYIRRDERNIL